MDFATTIRAVACDDHCSILRAGIRALDPLGANEPRIRDEIQSRKRSRTMWLRKMRRVEVE
jgi:hypothetical protein